MAILDEWTVDFISTGVAQTERLGVRLGELLEPHDLLSLNGELGAGKTTLARGIGRGWGSAQRVTSPTFSLINEYPRYSDGRVLYHVDCYRLESRADVVTAGLEDILEGSGAIMIEWAERIEEWLPVDQLRITLRHLTPYRRGLRIAAQGERSAERLAAFKQSAFGV